MNVVKGSFKITKGSQTGMKVADLNKEGLRAACKVYGIAYGKLNNDGMRKALEAALQAEVDAANAAQGIGPVGGDGRPRPAAAGASNGTAPIPAGPGASFGNCNPLETQHDRDQAAAAAPVVETPVVDSPREKVAGTVVKPKSLKIEKGREKQNDVTRPSTGSICRAIWDQLDAKRAKDKTVPTFEDLRSLMKQYGWQRNTAMTQYQRWKQFHGVMPRSAVDDADETEE